MTLLEEIYDWYCGTPRDFYVRNGRICLDQSPNSLQSVAEDVEYEDVSECETQEERAEKAQITSNNE